LLDTGSRTSQTEEQREDSCEIILSDDEDSNAPSSKRPRESKKYGGAYAYKSKFQAVWQKKWPCIVHTCSSAQFALKQHLVPIKENEM